MATTRAQVRQIAPELGPAPDADIDAAIMEAVLVPNAFASKQDIAGAYLAAHIVSLWHPELSTGGAVADVSVGGVRTTYAQGAFGPNVLNTTRYGMRFLQLARSIGYNAVAL
jgi:hypothetical protein